MNFTHTDDRRMLADTLQRFMREQYHFDKRQRLAASPEGCSRDVWRQLVELGALGALFCEDQGGMGGSGFDTAVVFEALGGGLLLEPLAGAAMAGQVLAASDNETARCQLQSMLDGECVVLMAHEEADTGATPEAVALRASAGAGASADADADADADTDADAGGWRLQGVKAPVAQASMAAAFVVSARVSGAPGDAQGLALFLVPAGSAGLLLREAAQIDGGRCAELRLDGVFVPAAARLDAPGQALAMLEAALAQGLLAACADALGAMEAAKLATIEYLQTRKQFGVPIGSFQALQHRMADLLLEIEQARSAVINAAAALQGPRLARERSLSAAKYTVGRVACLVAEESIQMHGGIGMSWELPLAHLAKRLVMVDHQLGDEDQHLQRYITLGQGAALGS